MAHSDFPGCTAKGSQNCHLPIKTLSQGDFLSCGGDLPGVTMAVQALGMLHLCLAIPSNEGHRHQSWISGFGGNIFKPRQRTIEIFGVWENASPAQGRFSSWAPGKLVIGKLVIAETWLRGIAGV